MEVFKKLRRFITHWYVRYLLATELYMVETWEKVIVHVLFACIFTLFWHFNYSIVTTCIAQLRSTTAYDVEQIL